MSVTGRSVAEALAGVPRDVLEAQEAALRAEHAEARAAGALAGATEVADRARASLEAIGAEPVGLARLVPEFDDPPLWNATAVDLALNRLAAARTKKGRS
jgi:hypothetical protein